MKLRLDFLFAFLLQKFGLFLVVLHSRFFSSVSGNKLLEVICASKSKFIQPQPKYKTSNFAKFNSLSKRLLRDIHRNQKTLNNATWLHCKHQNAAEFLL